MQDWEENEENDDNDEVADGYIFDNCDFDISIEANDDDRHQCKNQVGLVDEYAFD